MSGLRPGTDEARPRPERAVPAWLLALMVGNTVAAVGLFGDIARHVSLGYLNLSNDVSTTWHLVLYGGVLLDGLVLGLHSAVHGRRASLGLLRGAFGGLGAMVVGAVADAGWHEAFGIEASFPALVSPPHLVVGAGLALLMVTPIDAVSDGPSAPLDRLRSLVLALSVTSLLLVISLSTGYLTPLIGGSEIQAGAYVDPLVGTSILDSDTSRGLGTTLWFGTLVALVVALVRARAAPVAGTWTVAFGLVGLVPLVASGEVALPLTGMLVAYGLLSDLTATRQRPHPLATGISVAAMWGVMFAVTGGRGDLIWARELWGGTVTTGLLVGAAVGGAVRWATSPPRQAPRTDVGL